MLLLILVSNELIWRWKI